MGNKENIPYHSPIKGGEREGGGEGGLALSSFAALSFALYPFLSMFGPTLYVDVRHQRLTNLISSF
jgi:hypothetical protein